MGVCALAACGGCLMVTRTQETRCRLSSRAAHALTSVKGAIFINGNKDVGQGAGARLPHPSQLHQLQPRCRGGREAVELEREVHGLGPRSSPVVLGRSASNNSSD